MTKSDSNTSDVLGNILQGSKPDGAIPGLDELTMMIERYSQPLISKEKVSASSKTSLAGQRKPRRRRASKKKTTHYLTKEVYKELDEANNFLKGLLPPGSKLMSTKSKIVNYAVQKLLEDFESKGEDSTIVKKLIKDKKE